MRSFLLGALLFVSFGCQLPKTDLEHVQATFTRFQELHGLYDPAVADLYHDDATLTTVVKRAEGKKTVDTISGTEYKASIDALMGEAREDSVRYTYPDVTIKRVDEKYKIFGERRHEVTLGLERYLFLVSQDSAGNWKIIEQRVETSR